MCLERSENRLPTVIPIQSLVEAVVVTEYGVKREALSLALFGLLSHVDNRRCLIGCLQRAF